MFRCRLIGRNANGVCAARDKRIRQVWAENRGGTDIGAEYDTMAVESVVHGDLLFVKWEWMIDLRVRRSMVNGRTHII